MKSKSYIKSIANSLHKNSMSLLVGAGFSKNAINKEYNINKMKDWKELVNSFLSDIDNLENLKDKNDFLKIAELYQREKGRSSLENKLIYEIKDCEHFPSDLHFKLLSLPWNNILTTNYDTLLERADKHNKYEVIIDKKQLANIGNKNLLIKLHGSIDIPESCIISQSDYIKMRKNNKLFLHKAENIFIEQSVIILGFSGNDPNFQYILKSINEMLDGHNPKNIYLIQNHDNLPKNLHYDINVVNLNNLYPGEKISKQISLLLDDIKEELDYIENRINSKFFWLNENDIYELYRLDNTLNKYNSFLKDKNKKFPGWIAMPNKYRTFTNIIDIEINNKIIPFISDSSNNDLNLDFIYNYLTFKENSNSKIDTKLLEFFNKTISNMPNDHISSNKITEIKLYILKQYRQLGFYDEFLTMSKEIKNKLPAKLYNYYISEQLHYYLTIWDFNNLKKHLESWKVHQEDYYYRFKKLYFKSHFDYTNKSLDNALKLHYDLKAIPIKKSNAKLQSIESSLIILLNLLLKLNEKEDKKEEFLYKKLYRSGITEVYNWWYENNEYIKNFEHKLKYLENHKKELSFEINTISSTLNISRNYINNVNIAYSYLDFREKTCIPYFIGNISINKNMQECINRVLLDNKNLPLNYLYLVKSTNNFKKMDLRKILLFRKKDDIDQEINYYLDFINNYLIKILDEEIVYNNPTIEYHISETILYIISYLITKSSINTRDNVLKTCRSIYKSKKTKNIKNMDILLKRLLKLYTDAEISKRLHIILDFEKVDQDINKYPDPIKLIDSNGKINLYDKNYYNSIIRKIYEKRFNKNEIINRFLIVESIITINKEDKLEFKQYLWKDFNYKQLPYLETFFNTYYVTNDLFLENNKHSILNLIYKDVYIKVKKLSEDIKNRSSYNQQNTLYELYFLTYDLHHYYSLNKINKLLDLLFKIMDIEVNKFSQKSRRSMASNIIKNNIRICIEIIFKLSIAQKTNSIYINKIKNYIKTLEANNFSPILLYLSLYVLTKNEKYRYNLYNIKLSHNIDDEIVDLKINMSLFIKILRDNLECNFNIYSLKETKNYIQYFLIILNHNIHVLNYYIWHNLETVLNKINDKSLNIFIINLFKNINSNLDLENEYLNAYKSESEIRTSLNLYYYASKIIKTLNINLLKNNNHFKKIIDEIKNKIYKENMFIDIKN